MPRPHAGQQVAATAETAAPVAATISVAPAPIPTTAAIATAVPIPTTAATVTAIPIPTTTATATAATTAIPAASATAASATTTAIPATAATAAAVTATAATATAATAIATATATAATITTVATAAAIAIATAATSAPISSFSPDRKPDQRLVQLTRVHPCRDACGAELQCWTYLYDGSTPYGNGTASPPGGTCSLMATAFAGTVTNLSTLSWTSGNCHGGELRTLLYGGVSPAEVGSPAITEAAAFALATVANSSASCPGQCEALRREAASAGGGAPRLVRLLTASQSLASSINYGFTLLAELPAAGNEPPRKVLVAAAVSSQPWTGTTKLLALSYKLVGSDEELARLLPQ
ncbi:hypothetical protein GPECTOR_61g802 [Gonium pectorale]|uniref:Uncharacterized protein n=1 Tax=Gonium pectorale TaxID=33097 RepID=A0A150G4P0_GONPE|nr:hypothetical protein GPECTOR_61g802 [Gonium pectorale]|eukprot:KXZ44849.1 hypothetical protein GPECTOR_61g802 [Gonium pectorale]